MCVEAFYLISNASYFSITRNWHTTWQNLNVIILVLIASSLKKNLVKYNLSSAVVCNLKIERTAMSND